LLDIWRAAMATLNEAVRAPQLARELVGAEEELKKRRAQRAQLLFAATEGHAPGAELGAIDAAIAELEKKAQRLRGEIDELTGKRAAALTEKAQAMGQMPRRLAELRAETLALADQVDADMRRAAENMRRMRANHEETHEFLGKPTAYQFGSFCDRARSSVANLFRAELKDGEKRPENPRATEINMLGLRSGEVGARAWLSLRDHETQLADDLVPYFVTFKDASEAQARLGQQGREMAVVNHQGAFMLVAATFVQASRENAEAAAAVAAERGKQVVVLPVDGGAGGWALVPA
jgi:hypothetical protein